MNYLLALVGVLALSVVAAANAEAGESEVDQLCRDANTGQLKLERVSQVKQIIEQVRTRDECRPEVREALLALEPVVRLERVCSERAADVIVDFWARYVQAQKLPKALRKFFIGFGLQVSKLCKSALVGELARASADRHISEQDVAIVSGPIRASGGGHSVRSLFGKRPHLEDLMIIMRTDAKGTSGDDRQQVTMSPKHKTYFDLIRSRCVRLFKPVYDSLFGPIVRLTAIGLSYKDDELRSQLNSFRDSREFIDWFEVILACEPIVRTEALVVPAEVLTENGNKMFVFILEEEEKVELMQKTGLTSLDEAEDGAPVDYVVESVRMSDQVIVEKKLVKSYDKRFSDTTKLRLRLLIKLPKLLRFIAKSGKVQLGLKPVRTADDCFASESARNKFGGGGRLISEHSAHKWRNLAYTFMTIGLVGTSMALMAAFLTPLAPIYALLGFVVIFYIVRYQYSTYYSDLD